MPLDVDNPNGELVIDPYRCKQRYNQWNKKIAGISERNQKMIVQYLEDMRRGMNIAPDATKGKRGYNRLLAQKVKLKRVSEFLEKHEGIMDIAPKNAEEWDRLEQALSDVFEKMEDGRIRTNSGKRFLGVIYYVKSFKAFWHWYMTYMKRSENTLIPDITQYLTVKQRSKPSFVYFGEPGRTSVEEGFRKLLDHARYRYKAVMAFMFDSGIRSPTELVNVKGKDISPIQGTNFFECTIRDETSKTFGRRVKLMLCHELLRAHMKENEIGREDFLFKFSAPVFNRYLKRLGKRVLGKEGLTMYDFRHNAACYYVQRYQDRTTLMYRFGWLDEKMINYYTEFMGMRDTLQEEHLLLDTTKTDVEKKLDAERTERFRIDEELQTLKSDLQNIGRLMNVLIEDAEVRDVLVRKAREKVPQDEWRALAAHTAQSS